MNYKSLAEPTPAGNVTWFTISVTPRVAGCFGVICEDIDVPREDGRLPGLFEIVRGIYAERAVLARDRRIGLDTSSYVKRRSIRNSASCGLRRMAASFVQTHWVL